MKGPRVYYRFAWGNREIPKGELLFLLGTGKLNSVRVKAVHELKKEWITDRRALRKVGHECHCPTCPEYCMEDCVCGGICTCYYSMPKTVTEVLGQWLRQGEKRVPAIEKNREQRMNRVSRRLHGWRKRSGVWVKNSPVKVHWVIKN